MVLESILSTRSAVSRPWLMAVLGFCAASVGLLLSVWVFRDYASLVMVFLTVFALIPLFAQFMESEELADLMVADERTVLKQHGKVILSFVALFMGLSAAYAFWYITLPSGPQVFGVQAQTIAALRQGLTGHAVNGSMFLVILLNNLKVLMFCVLFSFLYGAGAIFILAWNASVIGVALGNFVQQGVTTAGSTNMLVAYATASGMSMVRYFIHGIPEITAYFVGGLAGGVLSVALVKHHWQRRQMDRVLLDASDLIIIAAVILVVAAFIETFITPIFF